MQFRDLLVKKEESSKVIITGIPYDKGASCKKGAKDAPDVIRSLSEFLPPFTMDGCSIEDIKLFDNGNIKCDTINEIYENTKELFSKKQFKLFLGGDHSISIALEKAFIEECRKNNKIPAIIHIDAHPDICDVYDGSKNSHACPNMRAIENGVLPEDIIMIGIRGYEAQEVKYFSMNKELKVYNASYINKFGIHDMLYEIIAKFDDRYSVYLSYDIDANDPSFAPGTGTPEAFGLNSNDVLEIILTLIKELPINVFDIVEVSPQLDCNDITSWLALKTIYEVFYILLQKEKMR